MGYRILPKRDTWRLVYRIDRGGGKLQQWDKSADSREYKELGLSPSMTLEQAKTTLNNARTSLSALERDRRAEAAKLKVERALAIQSLWLPPEIVQEFVTHRLPTNIKEDKPHQWHKALKWVAWFNCPPNQWKYLMQIGFHKMLVDHDISIDYCGRILKLVNAYGEYWCFKHTLPYYALDCPPRGSLRREEPTVHIPILEFTTGHLNAKEEQQWARLSFWLGLRPHEVDQLLVDDGSWRLVLDDKRFPFILQLRQSKLDAKGVEKESDLWKSIPCVEPEQKACLAIINSRGFRRPTLHAVKAVYGQDKGLRSFRKGFSLWTRERGYDAEVRSKWLGHLDRATIEEHYESGKVVHYRPPVKATSP